MSGLKASGRRGKEQKKPRKQKNRKKKGKENGGREERNIVLRTRNTARGPRISRRPIEYKFDIESGKKMMFSSVYEDDSEADSFEALVASKKSPPVSEVENNGPTPRHRHLQIFETAMEKWLPYVEHLTFKTRFVPLPVDAARALLGEMRRYSIIGGERKLRQDAVPLSAEDVGLLKDLRCKLDEELASFPGGRGFAKMARSPKDSVFDMKSETTARLLDQELQWLDGSTSDNDLVACFFRAANKAMSVASGDEVISLFLDSARIQTDLARALKDLHEQWEISIVLREWIPLPLESEFRGFVYNGRLTAISQYFWFLYFPSLVRDHDVLLARMTDFWEQHVRHQIPFDSYVIDFAVVESAVFVVELNPFGSVSGACCYDWIKDRAILYGDASNRALTTLRVRVEPMDDVKLRGLVPYWERYLEAWKDQRHSEDQVGRSCC